MADVVGPHYHVKLLPRAVTRACKVGGLLKTQSRLLLAVADIQAGRHEFVLAGSWALAARTSDGLEGQAFATWRSNIDRDMSRLARDGWLTKVQRGGLRPGEASLHRAGKARGKASWWAPGRRLLAFIRRLVLERKETNHGPMRAPRAPRKAESIDPGPQSLAELARQLARGPD